LRRFFRPWIVEQVRKIRGDFETPPFESAAQDHAAKRPLGVLRIAGQQCSEKTCLIVQPLLDVSFESWVCMDEQADKIPD
jgi:hypothetical protein